MDSTSNVPLWKFILELLLNGKHKDCIAWTDGAIGEFKLIKPEGVAKLWGIHKQKPSMNYDKLSRSLRYYYDKGIIKKVHGAKFVYRFERLPDAPERLSKDAQDAKGLEHLPNTSGLRSSGDVNVVASPDFRASSNESIASLNEAIVSMANVEMLASESSGLNTLARENRSRKRGLPLDLSDTSRYASPERAQEAIAYGESQTLPFERKMECRKLVLKRARRIHSPTDSAAISSLDHGSPSSFAFGNIPPLSPFCLFGAYPSRTSLFDNPWSLQPLLGGGLGMLNSSLFPGNFGWLNQMSTLLSAASLGNPLLVALATAGMTAVSLGLPFTQPAVFPFLNSASNPAMLASFASQ